MRSTSGSSELLKLSSVVEDSHFSPKYKNLGQIQMAGTSARSLASLAAKALIAAARPLAGTLSAGSIAAKALSTAARAAAEAAADQI